MARTTRTWMQFELKLSPGAEPWVIVRHRRGWFKIPLDSPVEELMRGVEEGWAGTRHGIKAALRTMRVTTDEWHKNLELARIGEAHLRSTGTLGSLRKRPKS